MLESYRKNKTSASRNWASHLKSGAPAALIALITVLPAQADVAGSLMQADLPSTKASITSVPEATPSNIKLNASLRYEALIEDSDQFIGASPDAVCDKVSSAELRLNKGSIVVSTKTPLTVSTESGSVILQKDATALVSAQDKELLVINLATVDKKHIAVVRGQQFINLPLGMQVLVSETRPSYRKVFRDANIGMNGVAAVRVNETTWMTTSNPSLEDLLNYDPLLSSIARDGECKTGRKLINRVAKAASCINLVAGDRKYSHIKS